MKIMETETMITKAVDKAQKKGILFFFFFLEIRNISEVTGRDKI